MGNKITYTVKATNSTRKILYWNPATLSYTDTNPILNVPAGTYSGLKARFEGSPEIIATISKSITVTDYVTPALDQLAIAFDGNSIGWGYISGPVPTDSSTFNNGINEKLKASIVNKLASLNKTTTLGKYTNICIPGQRTEEMLDRQSQYAFPTFDEQSARNVLLVLEGGNSMSGYGWHDRQDTPLQAYNLLKQYCQQEKARNPTRKIVVFTVLPRFLPNRPYAPDDEYYFPNQLIEYNRLVRVARANREAWLDAVADVAADGLIGIPYAPEKETYYHDGVHQNEAGAQILVDIASNAIVEAFYANAQPAPTPIASIVLANRKTYVTDNDTRYRVGPWFSFSDPNASSSPSAMYAESNPDGSVSVTENFNGRTINIYGPLSENGGVFHVHADGKKDFEGTAYSQTLQKDQLLYSKTLPDGVYGRQHVIRVVFMTAYGYDDVREYIV